MTNTNITPFVPLHTIAVEIAGMGAVKVRPINESIIKLFSDALLIAPNLYTFNAVLREREGVWYYHNKAELGVTGARPSPKKTEAALMKIAEVINESLKHDEQFQAKMSELQEQARVRGLRLEVEQKIQRYKQLIRDASSAQDNVTFHQRNADRAMETAAKAAKELAAYEEEHPEIVQMYQNHQ